MFAVFDRKPHPPNVTCMVHSSLAYMRLGRVHSAAICQLIGVVASLCQAKSIKLHYLRTVPTFTHNFVCQRNYDLFLCSLNCVT